MEARRARRFAGVVLVAALLVLLSGRAQFLLGGVLVNLGYRLQDHLESYDFEHDHEEELSPDDVWRELSEQNRLASTVRRWFPRTVRHPLVAMVVCMDARIDTNELSGDTRRFYYVIRTAGSVMSEREEEMLELAVAGGVKVVVLTRHTDCAAEKAAADPSHRATIPHLAAALEEREDRVAEFLARPFIAARVEAGELLVKEVVVNTATEALTAR